MSYRVARKDNQHTPSTKEEMQQAKYGILRRAVSCEMTYLDRRDHYHSIYYNKMVCAPGFEIDRKSGGLSYKVGDYYLSSLLGRGGGGSVYEGRHKKTNARVAVKVVSKNRSEEARAAGQGTRRGSANAKDVNASVAYAKKIQRTRKEYTVMSHLRDHRHITKLLEVVENDKAICLVMELGAGGDLFQLIQQKGRLSLYESWSIFRQLVSAVAHAHAQGFVHRDIKPENVFMSEDKKTATLGDWGFADVWCSFKELKEGVGSLNYCSPEIVGGLAYTGPEVDIWSLGTCLYAMVTGNLPFAADSPKQVVMNIKSSNFALSGCETDPLLYDLLSRLLNPDPLERAKMADVLQHRWFRNGPTLAHIKERRKRTGSSTIVPTTKNRHRTRVN
jgi:serine/threonine protein kinase